MLKNRFQNDSRSFIILIERKLYCNDLRVSQPFTYVEIGFKAWMRNKIDSTQNFNATLCVVKFVFNRFEHFSVIFQTTLLLLAASLSYEYYFIRYFWFHTCIISSAIINFSYINVTFNNKYLFYPSFSPEQVLIRRRNQFHRIKMK